MPHINAAGLALIEEFEGCELTAYPDPGTGGAPWTIGYGHTGPEVHPGMTITQEQAVTYLQADVATAEQAVASLVEVVLTPNQFSALVSFQYNTGCLDGSTMLRLINEENFAAAANEFALWVYGGGQMLPGLVRRRAAEKALFEASS